MKFIINIVGIVFIILGIVTLTYHGFTYTKQENVAQIGDVKVTADTQKSVYISPILGGLLIVTGLVLAVIRKK